MQFATKDLLVTVLPRSAVAIPELPKLCLFQTRVSTYPTFCHYRSCLFGGTYGCGYCGSFHITCGNCSLAFSGGCQMFSSCGGPGGSACDPTYITCLQTGDPFIIRDLEDLVTLRTELTD